MHNYRRIVAAPLALLTGLLLTSCGGDTPEPSTPLSFTVEPAGGESASASPEPSPSPTRDINERGDLVKEVDEVAGISVSEDPSDENWMQFKVTGLKEAVCTSGYADEPATGNYLLQIDLEVETRKSMREVLEEWQASPVALMFNTDWHAYASNGTTMNSVDSGAAYTCLDSSDQIPDMIGPAEKAVGSVVLEVSDVSGEIAWRPWFGGGELGWTWPYDLAVAE